MSLTHADFVVTSEELAKINRCIDEAATRYAAGDADPASSVAVQLSWTAGIGRSITVYFEGSEQDQWW